MCHSALMLILGFPGQTTRGSVGLVLDHSGTDSSAVSGEWNLHSMLRLTVGNRRMLTIRIRYPPHSKSSQQCGTHGKQEILAYVQDFCRLSSPSGLAWLGNIQRSFVNLLRR